MDNRAHAEKEHGSSWKDAYELVQEADVSCNENTITSHVVYKLKVVEKVGMSLKARICPTEIGMI